MKVPLLDLHAQLEPLREEILSEVTGVIDSTQYILGPKVQRLEEEVAAYATCRFAVGVSSGTDALLLALMALGIRAGDGVVTSPFTFFATAGAIARLGAKPLFVDIDPITYNLDASKLSQLFQDRRDLNGSVKAIIPVHLYGQCADMQPILDLAGRLGIPVIEDSAQSIGSVYPWMTDTSGRSVTWKSSGSMGDVGCFSFFPSKNLGGIGDGGMVVTNDEGLADKMRILRTHGSKPKYYHKMVGANFRLDPIQAAVLSVKLPHLESWHRKRRLNAMHYDALFRESGLTDKQLVQTPIPVYREDMQEGESLNYHIYNQYIIRAQRREDLRKFLKDRGVDTEVYYPLPLHLQECFADLGYKAGDFPFAESAAAEVLALPIYPELKPEMQTYVVQQMREFYD